MQDWQGDPPLTTAEIDRILMQKPLAERPKWREWASALMAGEVVEWEGERVQLSPEGRIPRDKQVWPQP